ncbi:hypothetical protein GCM10009677_17310 [Sphaerisporangium rubeum]|uniref:Uncharacterized protein n=1 Tax=Sphaerisporangium rubeum TaxID=321317 RepID=A0A7X0IIF3_9ACTN|nr:hypothetical protein [Sphaerisporangium rubeum]MBB6475814.1 hypothetical protein [Sphaerisporangium rubeum]
MSRTGGRHAEGAPVTEVRSVHWDTAKRAAAEELDRLEPGWLVLYGTWSRRFYAIALWEAPCPVLLDARTAEELRGLMRQAELAGMVPALRWTGVA